METEILVVADRGAWLPAWRGPVVPFEEASLERLRAAATVILAPDAVEYLADCRRVLDWKRAGELPATRLVLGTYKGRGLWSPETDALVEALVVHGRSEVALLASERLVFVPFCVPPPRRRVVGDDGTLFVGGRKMRDFPLAIAAIARTGLPATFVSDRLPPDLAPAAGLEIVPDGLPKKQYLARMARARVVVVPLLPTPVSHGHVEVVNAIVHGRPVVVTAGASCDEYVVDGVTGILVREQGEAAWADAIRRAHDQAERLARGAREIAASLHAPRYADYLAELVAWLPAPARMRDRARPTG